MLEQVTQGRCGCPIRGKIEDQAGGGSEQHDLVEDIMAHCRGHGLDDL